MIRSLGFAVLSAALLAVVMARPAVAGCPMALRDASGQVVARVEAGGRVRDASGRFQGVVDGAVVRDARGRLLGRLDAGGVLRDAEGRILARLGSRGELRGPAGRILLTIDGRGRIRTPDGKLIGWFDGYASGCLPVAAAYLIFLGL